MDGTVVQRSDRLIQLVQITDRQTKRTYRLEERNYNKRQLCRVQQHSDDHEINCIELAKHTARPRAPFYNLYVTQVVR